MQSDSIVCSDCGAAYAITPAQQQKKVIRCACGRYLLIGANNEELEFEDKTEPAAPPAPRLVAPKPVSAYTQEESPVIELKKTAAPTSAAPEPEGTVFKEAPVVEKKRVTMPTLPAVAFDSKKMMIGAGAIAAIAIFGIGLMMRSPAKSEPTVVAASESVAAPDVGKVPVAVSAPVMTTMCTNAPVRLDNGTSVVHSMLGNGLGKLEIENNLPTDAAVRVVGSDHFTVAWVYVQQGQTTMLNNIPFGTHKIMVASGSNWDGQHLTFRCDETYAEVDPPLEYKDRREDDRTVYSSHKVTLGRQKAVSVSKDDFFRGHVGAGG